MLEFFDKLQLREEFIEIDFSKEPYQFLSIQGKNLNNLIEEFLKKTKEKPANNLEIKNFKEKRGTVVFTYENENYNIYIEPINFRLCYEEKTQFKGYNESQLISILQMLSVYYYFFINDHFENNIENIISSTNIKEIILYPFFSKLFYDLKFNIDLNNQNMNKIKIKKELLEPLQLYIEKEEIINDNESINLDKILFEEELIFILNQERRQFINELNQYAERFHIIEPMKIVGNDGVGKSLTLQFYTSIEFKGYNKFYFNLKLFEKYGMKNYFFIELIRGFLSKENKININLKNYMKCIDYMQKLDLDKKNFFEVLKGLIDYIKKREYIKKNIIILDQFKYEYIADKDFEIFKSKINKEKFRLIICCSLNDGKIKKKMFKEYEKDILWMKDNSFIEENKISEIKANNYSDLEIEEEEENKINLNKIYLFKKRRAGNKLNLDMFDKNEKENPIQTRKKQKEIKEKNIITNINISDNIKNDFKNIKPKDNKNTDKKTDIIFEPKYTEIFPVTFPKHEIMITYNKSPVKIYYNNLVDLKEIIKEKEPEEIFNFMSNFNYLPKYYKKFNTFRLNQNLNNIKDNNSIIENFKKEMNNKISKNIKEFYANEMKIDDIYNNIYNYILKLRRKINKYNDRQISFKKLYNFSKKYPMKYIVVESEDESNIIKFDSKIKDKKFKINFSFPFVEYVLNNMIDEYDNDRKIDITNMSGSAFGNALELKIRKYINKMKEKVEIRRVWSLNEVSENSKKNKISEVENKTLNAVRYQGLEDIFDIKPLKDFNLFYFHPENEDNYLLDSILLINHGNNNFSIIAFQITKYKTKNQIESKKLFKDYIVKNIKTKFEELYGINIINAYLWFILSNDHLSNNETCKYLDEEEIKYVFYSIEKQRLSEERNGKKIENLSLSFEKKEALIYSKNNDVYNDEDNIKIEPLAISLFEDKLFYLSCELDIINYEKIRKSYFRNNYGLKLGSKLRDSIYETLKAINQYKNEFYFLFLFCFPFKYLYDFDDLDDDLVFIFKYEKIIYFCYKDYYYEIDNKNKKLKSSKKFPTDIEDMRRKKKTISYNKEEIDISSIKDVKEKYIIYLYKIYFIDDLVKK